jgi:hypothetical protein
LKAVVVHWSATIAPTRDIFRNAPVAGRGMMGYSQGHK